MLLLCMSDAMQINGYKITVFYIMTLTMDPCRGLRRIHLLPLIVYWHDRASSLLGCKEILSEPGNNIKKIIRIMREL